jgi:hypothetical protein
MPVSIPERLANVTLIALALFYIIMLGGGNYEHINVTPIITSAPPKSLAMLQGPFGFTPIKFWGIFRPITILLFILAIIFNWKTRRRKFLLVCFSIDIAVTIATFTYFAPEAGMIARAPLDSTFIDNELLNRAQLWKNLNLIRLISFYFVGVMLLLAVNRKVAA